MKTRILTACIGLPLLVISLLFLPVWVNAVVIALACGFSAWEFLHNTGLVKHLRLCLYSCAVACAVPIWCWLGMPAYLASLGILILFSLLFMESMLSGMRIRSEKIALCLLGALIIPYIYSGVVRILATEYGRWYVTVPFLIAFAADSGGFFVGKYFGSHKMAPRISPNKTWEGLLGGIIASVITMFVFTLIFKQGTQLRVSYVVALLYGFIGGLTAAFGDLCFSVIKRQTGIKDYGTILPGHGGILDRFDSFVTVCLMVEVLMALLPLGI